MQKKLIVLLITMGIMIVSGITYAFFLAPSPQTPSRLPAETMDDLTAEEYAPDEEYFTEDTCTENCLGAEAGYLWAEERDIDNRAACEGHPQAFTEGCQSYVEENYGYEVEE